MTGAECLRKYMKRGVNHLSLEAKSLLSQMKADSGWWNDKGIVDEWMRKEFEEWRRGGFIFDRHLLVYVELKARVKKFEAEGGGEVSVSDTLLTHTEVWLKERYLEWGEKYPDGCGGEAIKYLFTSSYANTRFQHNINDLSYNTDLSDHHIRSFIRLAAKVVAIEGPEFEFQEAQNQFGDVIGRLQAEIESANKRCESATSEATHLKAQLESAQEIQQAKATQLKAQLEAQLQEARKQSSSVIQKLQAEINCANKRCESATSEATHLKAQLESAKKAFQHELQQKEDHFASKLQKSEAAIQQVGRELENAKTEVQQAREECETLRTELSKLKQSLTVGIEHKLQPTTEEIDAARKQLSFRADCLHVALVGRSGSGCTSIFEALAAESSAMLISQSDGYALKLFENVILFGLPSWGSQFASQHRYFEKFKLFAFDAIFLVVDGNLLETDLNILKHCQDLAIPFRLIRTKCDLEILRMRENLEKENPFDIPFIGDKLYTHFNAPNSPFRTEVKGLLSKQLDEAKIGDKRVYLINRQSLQGRTTNRQDQDDFLLDEEDFIGDLRQFALSSGVPA
eukprot:Gregarina_sp_Pseudo_9__5731@NODE_834_length_2149_cov_19_084360_g782_i0_p1_GENE_NODE_834_length_2149_cov_19_084360_g782_i0NODE_834_length_2149_cov_19_084360_g782_i0_p1_ORF_typecomplete_len580_score136_36IIGP/PF05049_13/2_9e20Taxilin/PF09728_9/6_9e07WEMBL/PF05701_11/1_9e07DUF3584/PF12128_8/1e06BicD/PF09730_9/3_5e06CCCAP/PF15964_5/3_8e05AAA_13/PF13166_6/3_9e05Filament/PF00038_21/0_00022Myosin_tail_1/PF01576_19/6_9e05CCDC73/PF15818_5/0_00017SHE3/PF17078_5/0_81SHE3/PF17078_5/0_0024Prominin/PF05478_11